MKKLLKKIATFTFALSLVLSSALLVQAAETPFEDSDTTQSLENDNSGISTYSEHYNNGITISTSWTTIATSTTGFNRNVYIKSMNLGMDGLRVLPTDIRMLDKNGNVVWSENGAVPGQGSRTFWCGSNIYTIQAKTQASSGVIFVRAA